jgi:hypothetical protein
MRGSPLLSTLLLALLLGLTGIPVWSLTRPEIRHATPTPAAGPVSNRPLEITVTTSAPAEVALQLSGSTIWDNRTASETLAIPAEATDLVATVRWPGATTPQAARLVFSRDGETVLDTTLWGEAKTTEAVTLPASPSR